MKTYTLYWKHSFETGFIWSCCRFDSLNLIIWNYKLPDDELVQFIDLLGRDVSPFRLLKNGRLIARSATYKGV